MKKLIVGGFVAAVVCGCASVSVNQNDGANDNLKPPVAKDIVHVKYTVENKTVSASDKVNCLFGFITWGSTATHVADKAPGGLGLNAVVKNGAYANACDAAKCDEIVAAHYKVTVEEYFPFFPVFCRANAEITGFPAKVTGVEIVENKVPAVGSCGDSAKTSGDLLTKLLGF